MQGKFTPNTFYLLDMVKYEKRIWKLKEEAVWMTCVTRGESRRREKVMEWLESGLNLDEGVKEEV